MGWRFYRRSMERYVLAGPRLLASVTDRLAAHIRHVEKSARPAGAVLARWLISSLCGVDQLGRSAPPGSPVWSVE